jgi:DNA-directed RNA polymerase beta subunit
LKLVHIVDKKIHARRIGPYSLMTQQPVGGRSLKGGQRVGEIEMWALERCGASYILQEILSVKSDDTINRKSQLFSFLYQNINLAIKIPEAFYLLSCEIKRVSIILSNFTIKITFF